ncbi:hypothetical protein Cpap_3355 [Ruminiclostridium papyrosolvens DSM 2782]|uniref:Butirosin biosynthesis protein H N-terminal domain-containing protein n=1 Tax=Ruminiclostridium papyrosolvens DSM 2782 TaxID=588581 RepID=F1T8U6_9FIRM|nr:hypothetical protein [Ruminiclostridium papyrosolvens]EGD48928.1 hypothetical protein Cpap_3355 [Ruminiclostridium papyrosolvens DSM 2782]WES35412.1 hypothetical protein P0092_05405 [Ruminiclostridium papyrosolvens DSM 2782]
MKKVLEPMKAFYGMKDMLGIEDPYGDCMSMSDLATLNYFGLCGLEIIYNFYFVYNFADDDRNLFGCPVFCIDTLLFDKRENILKGLGIDIIEKQPKMDLLVESIRESIMNNRPIFLFVDLFYQKGRFFYYNNRHAPHACLVYGFDDENQVVYTIDDYNGYKTYIVSYDMIVQYCKGIFEYCNFRKDSLYFREYCFEGTNLKFDEEYNSKVLRKFFKNSLSKAEERYKSLNLIKVLSEDLESFINVSSFEAILSSVIYKRGSECFMIKNLYQYDTFDKNIQSEIDSKLNTILQNWTLIRNTVCHYNLNKKNMDKKCNKIKQILDTIYEDETTYSDLLYSQFRQFIG